MDLREPRNLRELREPREHREPKNEPLGYLNLPATLVCYL
jgi:hypothetical protein